MGKEKVYDLEERTAIVFCNTKNSYPCSVLVVQGYDFKDKLLELDNSMRMLGGRIRLSIRFEIA